MPWLNVNHTRLCWFNAVPTPLFALEVQRGGIPGQPGAYRSESLTLTSKQFCWVSEDYKSSEFAAEGQGAQPCGKIIEMSES